MPTARDFDRQLRELFSCGEIQHQSCVAVRAGDLHRAVGGYPNRGDHRMPICCGVMRRHLSDCDVILSEPRKGAGSSLTILYRLPRSGSSSTGKGGRS